MMTKTLVLGASLAALVGMTSCKKDTNEAGGGGGSAAKTTEQPPKDEHGGGGQASGTIGGSGSTFQKAFQESAMDAFMKSNPGVKVTYGGGGSGKGRQDLADQIVDFAGSDSAFKDEDKGKIKGGDILYFPILLGP
ncbi:MAG TPA: extracellular solute-binding protein, partial [Kofleriaceae bacterium]|nr:extracellular solute-binding protein [Kofleriaceae bacterium]